MMSEKYDSKVWTELFGNRRQVRERKSELQSEWRVVAKDQGKQTLFTGESSRIMVTWFCSGRI